MSNYNNTRKGGRAIAKGSLKKKYPNDKLCNYKKIICILK